MNLNASSIKMACFLTAMIIIASFMLPFFFRAPISPFQALIAGDLEPYDLKLSQLVLHDDRPTVYTTSSFAEVRGEKDAFVFLRTLPHDRFLWSLIGEKDANEALKGMVGQDIIVMKGLQSANIVENNGWILNPFIEPIGEAVTSKELGLDTTLSYRVSVEREGDYALYAELRHDDSRGTLFVQINDSGWSSGYQSTSEKDIDGDLKKTVLLGTWRLPVGEHIVTFRNGEPIAGKGYQSLYAFALVENATQQHALGPDISANQLHRFRYDVKLGAASAPYILGLDQPFDSSWRLQQNGKSRPPEALVEGRGMAWRMEAGESAEFTLSKRPVVPWWGGLALALVLFGIMRTVIYLLWEER